MTAPAAIWQVFFYGFHEHENPAKSVSRLCGKAELRQYNQLGIQTQSWSPIAKAADILTNKTVSEIAGRHDKSIAEIVLRWQYQIGSVSIPRSTSPQRQRENLEIFDFALSDAEMAAIAELSRPDGRLFDQDPAVYEEY